MPPQHAANEIGDDEDRGGDRSISAGHVALGTPPIPMERESHFESRLSQPTETSPLLSLGVLVPRLGRSRQNISGNINGIDGESDERGFRIRISNKSATHLASGATSSLFFSELWALIRLSLPIVSTYCMEQLPGLVSIVLVGRCRSTKYGGGDARYLDATALAVAFVNLTGVSLGIGLATAMDTLCSQAYGAGKPGSMGTYLQTGTIVLAALAGIVGVIFYNAASILLALGQPPDVAIPAGDAVWYLFPGIPFFFLYELLRKVLQAQNVASPMFVVSVLANFINLALGYYLVYHTEWGWLGASVARSACSCAFFALLLPYTVYSGLAKSFWTGLHPVEAIRGVPIFLSLGVPGMLQVCFEWWSFEALGLLCGLLPDPVVSIGANAVINNVSAMVYMLYLGISISGNVRIGNALGAGDAPRARAAAIGTIGMCAATALACATSLLAFRERIPAFFTADDAIKGLTSDLFCVVAVFQLPDAVNGAVQGVFRGSGRQNLGARLNFVAYYLLGIPCGIFLGFHCGIGVAGLWWGMTVALCVIAVAGTVTVTWSDWVELSEDAVARVGKKTSGDASLRCSVF